MPPISPAPKNSPEATPAWRAPMSGNSTRVRINTVVKVERAIPCRMSPGSSNAGALNCRSTLAIRSAQDNSKRMRKRRDGMARRGIDNDPKIPITIGIEVQ